MPRPKRALYRRCPGCQAISQASEFWRAAVPFNNERGRRQRRTCPQCGHIAPLVGFPIAERPVRPGGGQLMPSQPSYRRCQKCGAVPASIGVSTCSRAVAWRRSAEAAEVPSVRVHWSVVGVSPRRAAARPGGPPDAPRSGLVRPQPPSAAPTAAARWVDLRLGRFERREVRPATLLPPPRRGWQRGPLPGACASGGANEYSDSKGSIGIFQPKRGSPCRSAGQGSEKQARVGAKHRANRPAGPRWSGAGHPRSFALPSGRCWNHDPSGPGSGTQRSRGAERSERCKGAGASSRPPRP